MKKNHASLKDLFSQYVLHAPPQMQTQTQTQNPQFTQNPNTQAKGKAKSKGKFKRQDSVPIQNPTPQPKGKKKRKATIPAAFREQIWIRDCGKTFEAKCPTPWCQNRITVFDFQSGHNIPESKGGPTKPENLLPLCSRCNQSMGDRYTFDEWSVLAPPANQQMPQTPQTPPLTPIIQKVEEAPPPRLWCCC